MNAGMLDAGFTRREDERRSVISVLSANVSLIVLLYCILVGAYTVTVVALVRKHRLLYDASAPVKQSIEIGKAVASGNFRFTVSAFWKKAPWLEGSGKMLAKVKESLYGKNFLPFHVIIHGLAFAIVGYFAGRRMLANYTLLYPVVLFFATTGLLSADFYRPPKDAEMLLGMVVILQFAAVYGTALYAKWAKG